MKYLRQIAIIFFFCILGELVKLIFKLSIPSSVLGLLLLLTALCIGIVKLEMIEKVSDLLLEHLAFLFIPAGVGLMSCFGVIKKNLLNFTLIILISTTIVIITTGTTIEFLLRRRQK
ncbi:CidA/LrgA family protein [Hathewaya histolytica]|uniref:LrgA family protein n=1 Tax=Hathewaya histolytica TaxID=1498 RepID=A0A4U9RLE7_HATHI|nr:LrgA family protein [Hathewaya histolytica]